MNIALQLRSSAREGLARPAVLAECMQIATKGPGAGQARLSIGRKNPRFWQVAAYLLDVLDAAEGRLGPASAGLGITTGNLTAVFKSQRHLLAAAGEIRRRHGQGPIL
jgi:hypothetical protein